MRELIAQLLPQNGVTAVSNVTQSQTPQKTYRDTGCKGITRNNAGYVAGNKELPTLPYELKGVYPETSNYINEDTPTPPATPALDNGVCFWEYYEERAAIMEFDAGMTRPEAERCALEDCTQNYGGANHG
jgi:hypothetical protein